MIGKRFLPNGPFSAFFNDFEIFNGPFLIILHRLLWVIFHVNGTMAHGPLPSQSLVSVIPGQLGPFIRIIADNSARILRTTRPVAESSTRTCR